MKFVTILSLLLLSSIITQRLLKEETYKKIKEEAKWDTYNPEENPFKDYTHDQVHSLFGVRIKYDKHSIHMLMDSDDHSKKDDLPKEFDSRKQWPNCVYPVENQDHCGSCWAFSAAETLQDRFCIASNGKIKTVLSPQDMVSCDTGDNACNGGVLENAWKYLESTGIVTDECLPYASGDGKNIPHCPHGTCNDSKTQYLKYKAISGSSKELSCPLQIKQEIFAHGPVQTGFSVYEDFMHYKGGIYEYTHGDSLGGHAVKIVGWGEEDGTEYWIAQNSWGPGWGEDGFFRIKVGECFFDSNAYAGQAKVDDFSRNHFFLH